MHLVPVTPRERRHLRGLAVRKHDYANLPIMDERSRLWQQHNDCQSDRPMIHFETWTCEGDLLPPLQCESESARAIELQLLRSLVNHEQIQDDTVVPDWYSIGWQTSFRLFDLDVKREHSTDSQGRSLGYQFRHPIRRFPEDISQLRPSVFVVDRDKTKSWKSYLEDIFGDILPVRITMGSPGIGLSQNLVYFMGMESMLFAMMDFPQEFHRLMRALVHELKTYWQWMESEDLLLLNNGADHLGQGSFGFTNELPKSEISEGHVRLQDLWGYMDSQETVSISPVMFKDFFFPYYRELGSMFGLLSYGCCEPVHAIWDDCIRHLPNLRKISISPWCNEQFMGEALRGTNTIYHRKPSPNFIGVGSTFDEDGFREHAEATVKAASRCHLEISFRDIYSLGGDASKPRRAVSILRQVIDTHYQP